GDYRHAYVEPASSRGFHSDGDYRAARSVRDGRGWGPSGFPARPLQPAQRQGGPVRGYGATYRKSLRRQDGYAHAHADIVRYRQNPQTGEYDPGPAFRTLRRATAIRPKPISAFHVLKRIIIAAGVPTPS